MPMSLTLTPQRTIKVPTPSCLPEPSSTTLRTYIHTVDNFKFSMHTIATKSVKRANLHKKKESHPPTHRPPLSLSNALILFFKEKKRLYTRGLPPPMLFDKKNASTSSRHKHVLRIVIRMLLGLTSSSRSEPATLLCLLLLLSQLLRELRVLSEGGRS